MNFLLIEFIANLLSIGMGREQVAEKGYEFALAQEIAKQPEGSTISPHMMVWAAQQVQNALPEAYRIYESRKMMR